MATPDQLVPGKMSALHIESIATASVSLMRRPHQPAERLSDILDGLAATQTGSVSMSDVHCGCRRAFIRCTARPARNPEPVRRNHSRALDPDGTALMLLSLQLVFAARKPWLPARIGRLEIRRSDLRRLADRVGPHLRRLERGLETPPAGADGPVDRATHRLGLALALGVCLPAIPFANLLPSIGILLYGFALLERDGLLAIVATAVTVACLTLFGSGGIRVHRSCRSCHPSTRLMAGAVAPRLTSPIRSSTDRSCDQRCSSVPV